MEKKNLNYLTLSTTIVLTISLSHSIFAQKLTYSTNTPGALNTQHAEQTVVQVGAFRSEENARRMKAQWETQVNYPVNITRKGAYYLVIIGPVPPNQAILFEYNQAPRAPVTQRTRAKVITARSQPTQFKRMAPSTTQPVKHRWPKWPDFGYNKTTISPPLKEKVRPIRYPLPATKNQKTLSFAPAFIKGGRWYIGVDAGVLKPSVGSTMLVNNGSDFDPPNNIDRYSTQSSNHPIIAVEGGKFWKRQDKVLPGYALGLRYQYLFTRAISGRITQYSEPKFNNYDYNWGIQANVLSAYTKLQLIKFGPVIPYLNGGIGVTFNQSDHYTETGDPGIDVRDTPAFRSGTQTNFAYDLGLGLDFAVNPQILISLGYDFQSLGELSSGSGITTWSSQKLKLGNVYANTALLSLTYLFDHPESIVHFDNMK